MARSARQKALQKAKQAKADRQRADAEAAQAKAQSEAFNTPTAFYGVSAESSNAARDYINQNFQNPAVRAAGADLAFNAFKSDFQRQSDAKYAKEIAPLALDYQGKAQEIASTARDREIASQGREDLRQKEVEAGTRRYEADQAVAGTKYTADQGLAGTKYASDSEERQIGLTGEEQRKTLRQGTEETLALRRDARGAAEFAGRRFYG